VVVSDHDLRTIPRHLCFIRSRGASIKWAN
jgi:hypothetical protein